MTIIAAPRITPTPADFKKALERRDAHGVDTSLDVISVTFRTERVGSLSLWAFAATSSKDENEVIFQGSGGSVVHALAHFEQVRIGLRLLVRKLSPYSKVNLHMEDIAAAQEFAAITDGTQNIITVIPRSPSGASFEATKRQIEHAGDRDTPRVSLTVASLHNDGRDSLGGGWIIAIGMPFTEAETALRSVKAGSILGSFSGTLERDLITIKRSVLDLLMRIPALSRGWGGINLYTDSQAAFRLLAAVRSGDAVDEAVEDGIVSPALKLGLEIQHLVRNVNFELRLATDESEHRSLKYARDIAEHALHCHGSKTPVSDEAVDHNAGLAYVDMKRAIAVHAATERAINESGPRI